MTRMYVKALRPAPETHQALVVLETATGERWLGFFIPANEANRLAQVLGLTPCSCTPVYDLVLHLVERMGGTIAHMLVVGSIDGVTGALVLARGASELTLPCHPADGLALALRASAPIYASPEALAHACPAAKPTAAAPSASGVADWLERVSPDDFTAAEPGE